MSDIPARVHNELALQEELQFHITPRVHPPDPEGLSSAGYHDRLYIPYTEDVYLAHTVVTDNSSDLLQIFTTLEDMYGGKFPGIDEKIAHEVAHGQMCRSLGQKVVRYAVRLEFKESLSKENKYTSPVLVTPSTLMEGIETTRVGMGLMLAAPVEPSLADIKRLNILGLNPQKTRNLALQYNIQTNSEYYPI